MIECLLIDGPADRTRRVFPDEARELAIPTLGGKTVLSRDDVAASVFDTLDVRFAVYKLGGRTAAGTHLYVHSHTR